MSMSKYNLYNLARARSPTTGYKSHTFFKQKWIAKSELRAYHGEQVRERHWQKMFSTKLDAVVAMDPQYLSYNDGSLESAGRGSGLRTSFPYNKRTPYMLQTFAPLERRLDVAIFRALFASSSRQARQFVIHGAVTVNGQPVGFQHHRLIA
jgi:ribosomal protein S4